MEMIFTKEAMLQVFRIMVSCKMILKTPFMPNQHYLIQCIYQNEDRAWDQFHHGIPNKEGDHLFGSLADFARREGSAKITPEVAWRFFASESHYLEKVDEFEWELQAGNVPAKLRPRFLVAHLLLPVEVVSTTGEKLSVSYVNGPARVTFHNVKVLGKPRAFVSGQTILVHFGAVIAEAVSKKIEHTMLLEQRKMAEFIQMCQEVKEIDFNSFF